MTEKKKVNPRIIGAAIAVQAVIGGLTIRDISKREPGEVRGPRLLWKIWGRDQHAWLGGLLAVRPSPAACRTQTLIRFHSALCSFFAA